MPVPDPTVTPDYLHVGGDTAVQRLLGALHRRVAADPDLCRFFDDPAAVRTHTVQYLAPLLRHNHHGDTLAYTHRGLNIRAAEYRRMADHLEAALAEVGFADDVTVTVLAKVAALESQIVQGRP